MCYLNYSGNFYFITWVMMIVIYVLGMMMAPVIIISILIDFIS